jgi:SAM-dependent methyltransferase
MPGLSFLLPTWLFGLALLSIPLALHLFSRRVSKEVPFSDLRFLREAVMKRRRRMKLENQWLLLVRLLVFSLLVLALAKPVLRFGDTKLVKENDQSASVIILDNSASMRTIENGVERFDRARVLAEEVLRGLRPEDRVSLILASESPTVVYRDQPVKNSAVTENLNSARPGYTVSDVAQALALARGILKESQAEHKEVYLVTDLQQKAFEKLTESEPVAEEDKLDLYLLSVGFEKTGNLALTGIDRRPQRVVPGGSCQILLSGRAFGYGADTSPFVSVGLRKPGKGLTETSVPIEDGSVFQQSFQETVDESAYWLAVAEMEDQALRADNQRFLSVPIESSGRILLVEGDPKMEEKERDTFYFERAVKIYSSGLSGGRSYEIFQQAVRDELKTIDPSGFDFIVLANVPMIDERVVRNLETFVKNGGNLIISFGARVRLEEFNNRLVPYLSPFTVRRRVESGRRQPFQITAYRDSRPPLEIFSDSRQGDLTLSLFTQFVSLNVPPSHQEAVLARFDSGDPALVEYALGRGRVILWPTTLDSEWNDMPLRPLYLPFWAEVIDYLESTSLVSPNYEVGQPVELTVDFSREVKEITTIEVIRPDGKIDSIEVDPLRGSFRTIYTETWEPGFYRLHYPADAGIRNAFPAVFAVNLSPEESDLHRVNREELELYLTGWNLRQIEDTSRTRYLLAGARFGRPLWDILLLLLFIGLIVETLYANRAWQ